VNFAVTEDLKLSFLVNNLANRMPDMDVTLRIPGSSGAPYNSSNFDLLGRAYYLEAKLELRQVRRLIALSSMTP
jgi:iron complex outermembrane receptor protein